MLSYGFLGPFSVVHKAVVYKIYIYVYWYTDETICVSALLYIFCNNIYTYIYYASLCVCVCVCVKLWDIFLSTVENIS